MLFIGLTTFLLVFDLERPECFLLLRLHLVDHWVEAARTIQLARFDGTDLRINAGMGLAEIR